MASSGPEKMFAFFIDPRFFGGGNRLSA